MRGCRLGPYINDAEALVEFGGLPTKVRDAGSPSLVEEQRAARAFWRLQLLYDLRKAARGNLLATWPAEDVDTLRSYNQTQLLFLYYPTHVLQTNFRRRPKTDEIYSAVQYLERVYGCHWPDEVQVPGGLQAARASEWWPLPRHEARGDKKLAQPSAACQAWPNLAGHLGWWELARVMWLGFAFSSEERMQGRGLLGNPRQIGGLGAFKYAFMWHSMVPGAKPATFDIWEQ